MSEKIIKTEQRMSFRTLMWQNCKTLGPGAGALVVLVGTLAIAPPIFTAVVTALQG